MFRSYRRLWFLTSLWLASHASAQEAPKLTLAAVLQRGPALASVTPRVLWLPGGHEATVILGGLVTGTLLDFVLMPGLLARLGRGALEAALRRRGEQQDPLDAAPEPPVDRTTPALPAPS